MTSDRFTWPLFCLVLALLAVHELDAMIAGEWRLLPILSDMTDADGMRAFIWLHIPMFGVMFWLGGHPNPRLRYRAQFVLDLLVIGHGIAHFLLNDHPDYGFEPPVETVTVFGAALAASLHVFLIRKRIR